LHFGSDQPLRLGDRLDINAERYLRNQRGQLILQGLMLSPPGFAQVEWVYRNICQPTVGNPGPLTSRNQYVIADIVRAEGCSSIARKYKVIGTAVMWF